MNWIPIDKQTPPPYTKLLLTVRDTEWSREEGYHEVERVECKVWNGDKRAIAWMPMPIPYHTETENPVIGIFKGMIENPVPDYITQKSDEKEDTTDYPLGYNPWQE